MADVGAVRGFGDRWLRFGGWRVELALSLTDAPDARTEGVFPTRGLQRFLSYLAGRESPAVLDLGPVVGSNVTFFGEQLGCKIFVEDLFADVDRFLRRGAGDELPKFFEHRLTQPDASVDGVLCWDLFDYLEPPAAKRLARHVVRVLKPGGAVLSLFGTGGATNEHYTKYAIVDPDHLEYRPYDAVRGKRPAWGSRDAIKLFDGLAVAETYLLKIRIREMLFRKPDAAASGVEG